MPLPVSYHLQITCRSETEAVRSQLVTFRLANHTKLRAPQCQCVLWRHLCLMSRKYLAPFQCFVLNTSSAVYSCIKSATAAVSDPNILPALPVSHQWVGAQCGSSWTRATLYSDIMLPRMMYRTASSRWVLCPRVSAFCVFNTFFRTLPIPIVAFLGP